jgi:diaminohydroxyphosphoribosylaminopyrimidine deaminase / 5-amino-6-(5-phosphoribosylamino)uracil reductase
VIARGDEVIGEGFHAELGGLHAERAALADAAARGTDPRGATIYLTLEPCAHHGRQPPCTDAILEAGIARVVIASDDPSDKAAGRGPGILRDGGVEVEFAAGAEASAARLLNQSFRKHSRTGLPLVTLKMAMSLDGRVATSAGDSKWISGPDSRRLVHRWRAESDAVAVGIGTAFDDDPQLTARDVHAARQPARVVFDSSARLPLGSQLVATIPDARLIVVTAPGADSARTEALREAGAEVLVASGGTPPERVRAALAELGRLQVTSVLLEGGPVLAGAFADAGEVDAARIFVAPLLIGGGAPALAGEGAATIEEATRALASEAERIGDDVLLAARLREW